MRQASKVADYKSEIKISIYNVHGRELAKRSHEGFSDESLMVPNARQQNCKARLYKVLCTAPPLKSGVQCITATQNQISWQLGQPQ